MNVDSLTAFVESAERGSFSAASRTLGLSPSGISRAIDRLEQDLGVTLLVRSTRKLRLTAEGEILFQRSREIIQDLKNAREAVQAGKHTPTGTLRVSLPVAFGRSKVAPLIGSFSHQYPEIRLEINFTDRNVDLIEEEIDVAVRIGELADSRLVARKLTNVQYTICASPDYLRRFGTPSSVEELSTHTCVYYCYPGTDTPFRWRLLNAGTPVIIQPHSRIKLDQADALVETALGGAGLIYAPCYMVQSHLNAKRLVPILRDFYPSSLPVSAVYPYAKAVSVRVKAFVEYLAEQISDS